MRSDEQEFTEEEQQVIEVIQNEKGFDRLEDEINYALLRRRNIILGFDIEETTAIVTSKNLYYLASKSKEPIKIIINSPGGCVYSGLLLYNTIRDIVINEGIEVITEVRGQGSSMAAVILQAGSIRQAFRASRILLHEVASIEFGKVTEMEEGVKEIRKMNDTLRDIFANRTGHSREELDRLWTKKDVWFSAEEALDYKLIDRIID